MNESTFLPNLPHSPGVYLMRDSTAAIIYIGKARDLKKRVASYFVESRQAGDSRLQALVSAIRHVDYVACASEREALLLEQKLISEHQPVFNIMWKDDKSYPYVALTVQEDFPRLFLTRKKKDDGTVYFGPYPSVKRVRQLLRWAWRKRFFPMRECDLDIKEGKPYAYEKVKSCLYLHTGQCSAPCLAKISKAEYGEMADRARWFFEGRKDKLIEQWRDDMERLSASMKFEEAAKVRDRIETLEHMDERVTFREMTPDQLEERVRGSRAIQELMRALGLKKPPERIECFDISHIQGVEKVASMVSFDRGQPDKSNYRKFIIRTVEGIDDFKSMAEVVGRRYKRLKAEARPFPDLILIDGGKGQLSAALKAIQEVGVQGIPIAALAKEEEELFVPGRRDSIRLPQDSGAQLLVRHVRDEAHRFAITFHRLRRGKRALDKLEES
ncbi:MAG: excinuclease ABC subunit UvrC [Elusimicrobia bacterium]|nr:excinuclease ABC subunit UvrC [Elusimicrobiota bacterium]